MQLAPMYPSTMSHYKRDRNHGQGLPDNLGDESYQRIQEKLQKKGHPVWDMRPAEEGDGGTTFSSANAKNATPNFSKERLLFL